MIRVIVDDADDPPLTNGLIHIGYSELVNGYRHAYRATRHGSTVTRYSRTPNHPPDPACPECAKLSGGSS